MVLLDEGFQLDTQALAVIQHAMVVVRNPPGAGINVIVSVESDLLGGAAHFCIGVAPPQRPAAAAGLFAVFQNLDVIPSGPEFQCRDHAAKVDQNNY